MYKYIVHTLHTNCHRRTHWHIHVHAHTHKHTIDLDGATLCWKIEKTLSIQNYGSILTNSKTDSFYNRKNEETNDIFGIYLVHVCKTYCTVISVVSVFCFTVYLGFQDLPCTIYLETSTSCILKCPHLELSCLGHWAFKKSNNIL